MKRTFWGRATLVRRWHRDIYIFTAILRYTLFGRERGRHRRIRWRR